jgi:hypothetical protein
MYRFFLEDPLFFTTELKVSVEVGQTDQTSVPDATVDFAAIVYYWLDTPGAISYQSVNQGATPLYNPATPSAGSLPSYLTSLAGTWTIDGSGLITQAANGSADQVVYVNNYTASSATGFWVESTVQITDATDANQEAFLFASPSGSNSFLGNRVSVQIKRGGDANSWIVEARDGFDTPGLSNIGSGTNLTNVQVDLALKAVGTLVTAYWRLHGDTNWHPFVKWTTGRGPFATVGVATWDGAAKMTVPIVRPLHTVTS